MGGTFLSSCMVAAAARGKPALLFVEPALFVARKSEITSVVNVPS